MIRVSLAVCMLLAAVPSCPDLYSLATHGFTVPTVDGATATAAPDPAGLRVTVAFTATNPNPFPITLSAVDYQLVVQGKTVFAGSQADPSVPEHGTSKLDLGGVIDVRDPVYRTLSPGGSQSYTLTGTAHVQSPAGVPVDVEFEGAGSFIVPGTLPTH
ncbi:MAG: LEA type 2 family protein [Myxococcales bacterium]